MKKLLVAYIFLAAGWAQAEFRLGGELVNPRTLPHILAQANVTVSVPESWSVEKSASQLSAAPFALAELSQQASQINLKSGIDSNGTNSTNCKMLNFESYTRTTCMINAKEGVVFIENSSTARATLHFTTGNAVTANIEMDRIIKSLKPLD